MVSPLNRWATPNDFELGKRWGKTTENVGEPKNRFTDGEKKHQGENHDFNNRLIEPQSQNLPLQKPKSFFLFLKASMAIREPK